MDRSCHGEIRVDKRHPQNRTKSQTPGRSSSSRSWLSGQRKLVIAASSLLLILVVWFFWPSPYSNVANLGSRGSNIIALGDSLTAGFGAPSGQDYPSRLSTMIGVPVLNAGVSGDTTEAALARLDPDVLSRDPRIVIVGLGGNDFLRGVAIASTEANLRILIRKIHDAGAMVVLLGFSFPSISANYEKMYEGLAREERCLLISHPLHGILTDAALKSDEIHPNARGYQLMAERISVPCSKLIRKADSAR
jgi:acyl-CoA thioesterase-1